MTPSPKSAERGELLACPFCGAAPETQGSGEGQKGLMIDCITPGCVNPHVSYYDHPTAIRAWNTRTPPATLYAGVREAKRLVNERLEDLATANALYSKDQRLTTADKIARNEREISWLKDLRSAISTQPAGGIQGSIATKPSPSSTPATASETAGWQPIETAPRDGTPVLVWHRGAFVVAEYCAIWQANNKHWCARTPSTDESDRSNMVTQLDPPHIGGNPIPGTWDSPTHWMPLPTSPPLPETDAVAPGNVVQTSIADGQQCNEQSGQRLSPTGGEA